MKKPQPKRRAAERAPKSFRRSDRGRGAPKRSRDAASASARARAKPTREERVARAEKLPAPELDSAQRKRLRALAHHLTPLVQVGHAGVTDEIVAAVQRALFDHELIKVRLYEPEDKHGMAAELATRTKSGLCGLLGHTVILFRPHADHSRIVL